MTEDKRPICTETSGYETEKGYSDQAGDAEVLVGTMADEDRTHKAVLFGDFAHIPFEEERRSVRVFLCADPLDSDKERRALRSRVYPKLREYCRHVHGVEFQVLDAYHGIHPTDFYCSKVRKVRMELLKECLKSSAGPCFMALIGEEYGEPCLPPQIDAEEFEKIIQTAEEHRVCTKVLDMWYLRDENGVPPVYHLLGTEEALQRAAAVTPRLEDSKQIRILFDTVIPLCVQEGILEAGQADKYFSSALEDELKFALQDQPLDLLDQCICYIHKVPYKAFQKQKPRSDEWMTGSSGRYQKLCHIRDIFIPSVASGGSLQVYSTTTTCNNKVGYTEEKQQQYIDGLCKQFFDDMMRLIQRKIPKSQECRWKRNEEAMHHLSLCTMYSELQWYQCKEAEEVRSYILQDTSRKILVVLGEPCSGKTVLLSCCAKKIHSWLKDSNPALLVRFVSCFKDAISLRSLMTDLCRQLANILQKDIPIYPEDTESLRELFVGFLAASSKQSPLILMIDDIDHVRYDGALSTFWWIPFPVPEFTKIIVSVTNKKTKGCDIVNYFHHDQILLLEVKPTRKQCNDALRLHLLENKRRITSGQQVYVNRSLERNMSHMQMVLLGKEVVRWRSHQDIDEHSIGKDLLDVIERLFHKLEVKYGYELVARVLSFITLSRSGIGDAELVDLLTLDDDVLAQLYTSDEIISKLRVPDWLITMILLDLKDCLSQRIFTGCKLVCWTNSQYQHVVFKLYLTSQEVILKLRTNMCHYFTGRWASGRAKLMPVKQIQNSLQNGLMSNIQTVDYKEPVKIYVDRHLPSQPWLFNRDSQHQSSAGYNIRKAYELPFHLKECGKLDDLYNNILLILPYYKALLHCGQLHTLIQNVDNIASLQGRKEIYFICDILKETRCLLSENPDAFEMILISRMMPLVYVYSDLFKFVKQVYHEGIRTSSIVLQHSPLVEVPVTKHQYQLASSVINIFEHKTKSLLIVVFENSGIYSWNLRQSLALEYQPSSIIQVRGAAVESQGRFLALLTTTDLLIILDCTTWAVLNEIKVNTLGDPQESKLTLKSFHLSTKFLFACFESSSIVRVFAIFSGTLTLQVILPQNVTFFACSNNGKFTLLGQTNKIFLCDNDNFSHQIDLPMDQSRYLISNIYIYESFVYIIDKASNITVWDIAEPKKPQLLEELYTNEDYNEVICTELSSEWLLICRSQTIDVWKTMNWGKNMFKSPKGKKFICCIFTLDYEAVIAAVENSALLFVYSRESGQCISTLTSGQLTMLTKYPGLGSLVAVSTDKILMAWDLKLIASATSYSQTGRLVILLLLCPEGNNAYTADDCDMVCKWDILSCRIISLFQHCDPVETMKLTSTGDLLITSVSSGDLYVWVTHTGENIHRIQCDPVSQLLITPSSHCVVSICKNGISRVWKPITGNMVCTIHTCLKQAVITPESTFMIGMHDHRLLAANLWSGYINKHFQCPKKSDSILAFRCLLSHPDFIIVITAHADLYTWNVVEETICHQLRMPIHFSSGDWFNLSYNGNIITTIVNRTIHYLSTHDGRLGVLHAPSKILHQHLSKDGNYFLYVCQVNPRDCSCDFHSNPVLTLIQVFNGEILGQWYLGKMPSTMTVSEDDCVVCIGFVDGTLGVYLIAEMYQGNVKTENIFSPLKSKESHKNTAVKIYRSQPVPNILWTDSRSTDSNESL